MQRSEQLRRIGFGPKERARVLRILRRDPTLRALIGDLGYRTRMLSPWSSSGFRDLLGGSAELVLSRPLEGVTATLPDRCPPPGGGAERTVGKRFRIERAERLLVFAELRTRRVAIIRVLPPADVEAEGESPGAVCAPRRD